MDHYHTNIKQLPAGWFVVSTLTLLEIASQWYDCGGSRRRNLAKGMIWKIIGLAISLALAIFLLTQLDLQEFRRIATSISIVSLFAALGFYLLLNGFRLLRFQALLNMDSIPFSIFYPIVLYHNFLVRTLPFKTGELSYIVLLRQHLNQPVREGVSSLVASRLFELFMVIVVGGGSLLLASNQISVPPALSLLIVIGGAGGLLAALYFSGPLLRIMVRRLPHLPGLRHRDQLLTTLTDKLGPLADSFDRVRQPRIFRNTLVISALTYSMSTGFNLVLLYAIGIEVSLGILIGVISIVMLTDALPLATISGLGMVEGGWTFGLVAFAGMPVDQAASLGFFLHACQLLAAASTGILGYAWLQVRKRYRLQPEQGGG